MAQPFFHLNRGRSNAELDKGKNKEELTGRQVGVCVHFYVLWRQIREEFTQLVGFLSGYGCSRFPTLEYGAVKDL